MAVYKVIRLFSKKKKGEPDLDSIKVGGAAVAGGTAGKILGINIDKKISRSGKVNNSEVYSKLEKLAKKKGVVAIKDLPTGGPGFSSKAKMISMAGSRNVASLAHELGHADYHLNKDSGKIGRAAHKAYVKTGGSRLNVKRLQPRLAAVAGAMSGERAAKLEAEGKKQSKLERHADWAIPAVLSAPVLVSEGLASRKGLKFLKNSGASKELRKAARKDLVGAWGTYAGAGAINAGIGELSRGIAYRMTKRDLDRERELKNKKD